MLIHSGTTLNGSYQIETSTQVIAFKTQSNSSTVGNYYDINVQIVWSTKFGTKTILPVTPLGVLLSANSVNRGIQVFKDPSSGFGHDLFYFYLSNEGAFPLSDGDYLQLQITGSPTNYATAEIYAIESPITASKYNYVEPHYLNANITKQFDLTNVDVLVYDFTNITQIMVTYPTKTIHYKPLEVQVINLEMFQISSALSDFGLFSFSKTAGAGMYQTSSTPTYSIPLYVKSALSCEVTTATNPSVIYKFSELALPKVIEDKAKQNQAQTIVENIKELKK